MYTANSAGTTVSTYYNSILNSTGVCYYVKSELFNEPVVAVFVEILRLTSSESQRGDIWDGDIVKTACVV